MAVSFEVLLAGGTETWPAPLGERLSPAVALPQGLVLVPLTAELKDRLTPGAGDPVLGFDKLTAGMAAVAAGASQYGPVVYVHQETFAGTGFEAAAVWRSGKVVLGPLFTANHEDDRLTDEYLVVSSTASNAINQALRHVGVDRGDAFDEYSAVGLDRHRWTDSWKPAGEDSYG